MIFEIDTAWIVDAALVIWIIGYACFVFNKAIKTDSTAELVFDSIVLYPFWPMWLPIAM